MQRRKLRLRERGWLVQAVAESIHINSTNS
jgi:hypothetical protein